MKTILKQFNVGIFLAAALLAGCASNSTLSRGEGADRDIPCKRSTMPYRMAVLDTVYMQAKGGGETVSQVEQDGALLLPNGEKIKAVGVAPEELKALIQKKDKDVASIRVEEFRGNRVTIMGEVFHQIHVEMADSPMRVIDVIGAANGFTPLANTKRITLLRQNAGNVEVYELNIREVMEGKKTYLNMLVKPGDVINVPRNFL